MAARNFVGKFLLRSQSALMRPARQYANHPKPKQVVPRPFPESSKPKVERPGALTLWDESREFRRKLLASSMFVYILNEGRKARMARAEAVKAATEAKLKEPEIVSLPPNGPLEQKIMWLLEQQFKMNASKTKAQLYKTMWTVGQHETYGVSLEKQKRIVDKVLQMYPATNRQIVVNVMKECYAMPQREFQYAAQEVASANFRLLCGKDDATQRQALLDIKWMLTHDKSYCDTVDWIASKLVGKMAARSAGVVAEELDSWAVHENVWLRRAALLHQLHFDTYTDRDKLFRFCLQSGKHSDLFVQKAIGTALKQYSQVNGEDVKDFLSKNNSNLPKLSVTMALK